MKKFISMLLCTILLLSLCACSKEEKTQDMNKAPEGKVLVGFGRVVLSPNPNKQVSLTGYEGNGTPPTPMAGKLIDVCGTCIAITDTKGETALIFTVDTIFTTEEEVNGIRAAIKQKTGVTNVVVSATHTHASMKYQDILDYDNQMAKAAADALADRAPATVQTGSTDIEGMNFVRLYMTKNGIVIGENCDQAVTDSNPIVSHVSEPDKQMQMIRFLREGKKKDVLMLNWQAHPFVSSTGWTSVGRGQRALLSSDFVGFCREYIEANSDCMVAYYSGACGNLNPLSRFPEERKLYSEQVKEYGDELGKRVLDAMGGLKDQSVGDVVVDQQHLPVNPIPGRGSDTLEITAIRVGDIGFATVPFEMFDTNGKQIKEKSTCETTFVLTCASMPKHSYIPSQEVWDYNTGDQVCYELNSSKHQRGTAEQVADALAEMLNQ